MNVRDHVPLNSFVIQSHRGVGDLAPEATIEAIELGWKHMAGQPDRHLDLDITK